MKTRVLIVDDSPLICAVLREAFERTQDIEVVGEAGDGRKAIDLAQQLRPDIVTMDVLMPVMDGLSATEEIMRLCPTPIVIIARDGGDARALAVEALGKGALAVFPKPVMGFDDTMARELAAAVRKLANEASLNRRCFWPDPARRSKIRVLLVDDSSLVRQVLRKALSELSDMEVVADVGDGMTALKLATDLHPDVVCLDMFMPMMGGYETAQRLLRQASPGILLVTCEREEAQRLIDNQPTPACMEVFVKPLSGFDEQSLAEMARAIRRLAQSTGFGTPASGSTQQGIAPISPGHLAIVGIVGSTGAPRVLHDFLRDLPADFPAPIAIVQHTERGYAEALASWLSEAGALPVRLGRDGHVLTPGDIVLAPDDTHMEVHTGGVVSLCGSDPVNGFRPSASVLLHSLAETFGQHALGLVLSGMGSDGADGLGAIYSAGGCTIVEDPDTAAVPGMPKQALAQASGAYVERASRLAWLLSELVSSGRYRKTA
jgi:two-component system, chemotaxis family, protein-glutamate methylesterase/glutaminase